MTERERKAHGWMFMRDLIGPLRRREKTITRRLVTPQPEYFTADESGPWKWEGRYRGFAGAEGTHAHEQLRGCLLWHSPAKVGDLVWVRETFSVVRESENCESGGDYCAWEWEDDVMGDPRQYLNGCSRGGLRSALFYPADGEDDCPSEMFDCVGLNGKVLRKKEIRWRPSIRMPRWASRTTLLITDVQATRLHETPLGDVVLEGLAPSIYSFKPANYGLDVWRELWIRLYGQASWDANPWVYRYAFDTFLMNIDQYLASEQS